MGYIKLLNNKYKITIELGYDILGKRRRKTEIFSGTLQEAKIREAELTKKNYRKSNVADVKELSFEQYSEIFLKRYCKDNIGIVTTACYEKSLTRILPIIGRIKLNKRTPYMLDSMYQKLKKWYYKAIRLSFNVLVL